ncbi:MAG: glycosyltransferase family protein [Anaerolineae bacterium]|jgi:spore coat polysaccharide biosynthesis protein SpsF|nr:glycosyltransferase family protein [Anaerolineae bacterium]
MKVVAIIQARTGSTRLPAKVLLDISGASMLERVVTRTQRAKRLDGVVVATTVQPADDAIMEICADHGWSCFRGSEEDVLDRYYRAAIEFQADVIVRITSDCPLIDPEIVSRIIEEFLDHQPEAEYVSNTWPKRTFPRGLDIEVIRFDVLERAWREDDNLAWREHVTPYIYRNPERFRIHSVTNDVDYSFMRWTVDTLEDLMLVRRIYEHFGDDQFSWLDVVALLEEHPEWTEINRHIQQKLV